MADIRLSVSPETLRRTAMEMNALLRKIRLHASRIQDISGRTRGYWQGDAGTQDRSGYRECAEELLEAARNLENRSVTLMRMAGVYQELDETIGEANTALDIEHVLSL